MKTVNEYETDFYAWLLKNAQLMRERKFTDIDVDNIAEELEAMGRSEKRELSSRLTVLLAHLLKWQFQAIKRLRSWKNTIIMQRIDIKELLDESPSLRYDIEQKIDSAYEKAKLNAEYETGIDAKYFLKKCPFSFEHIMDRNFFPHSTD